jgi:hypothetical protein
MASFLDRGRAAVAIADSGRRKNAKLVAAEVKLARCPFCHASVVDGQSLASAAQQRRRASDHRLFSTQRTHADLRH